MKTTITADCRLCNGQGHRLIWQGQRLVDVQCIDCEGSGQREYTQAQIDAMIEEDKKQRTRNL